MRPVTQLGRISLPIRYILGIIIILALSLWIFSLLMQPSMVEVGYMALLLAATAVISALAGYGLYRLGWLERSPTIRWTLLSGYALASILTFLNVWLAARSMFASPHDLLLATVLLIFAGGIAMVLGYFLSSALTDRIRQLDQAARIIADGNLDVRLPVQGRDELSDLGRTFNRMAAELQAAARKRQEIETMRRDLLAWTGHDLQTPLTSVRLILEALVDGVVEDPETVQRYLQTAQKDVRSLSQLVDDLFQLAQLDAGGLPLDLQAGSLTDLISETLESFTEQAARRGVSLRGQVGPGVDPLVMDTQKIGRVLDNLMDNALRYTPAGGFIEVSAADIPEGVRLQVDDSGPGIPEEDLPNIFERFYRGEKSRSQGTGGAGLGLAIARGIVVAHGGQISAENTGQGTRVIFTLPKLGIG
jgi:signal transduction histidine kinase